MRYVAAALLVALGGGEVSEAAIKKLLDGVGIDCDSEKAAIIVKELAGKNLEELIAEGNGKGGRGPAEVAFGWTRLRFSTSWCSSRPHLQWLKPSRSHVGESQCSHPNSLQLGTGQA